tara:strand:+ start:1463 stop:1696 length:234 start_codon:yes stop_codon:yes gene_type:complete
MIDFEERQEHAVNLVASVRGDYIMAKALYLAYQWLDSESDDRKRQPSDMYDMMTILSMGYPNFYNTFMECEKREIQI